MHAARLIRLVLGLAASFALIGGAAVPPAGAAVPAGADRVTQLPTLGPVSEPQFAGYASTETTPCADLACSDRPGLFYWLAGRDADYRTQPTVLWSNGGPGASSFYGFLSENGPYTVGPSGLTPYAGSWTSVANYLFFDQPLGVGMSFPFQGQVAENAAQGTRQFANAVDHVVTRDGLRQSPLFLAGESYGGTYMPLLARRLLKAHPNVDLGGVVIVSGWVNPGLQVGTTAKYAFNHGLIGFSDKRRLDRLYSRCRSILRRQGADSLKAGKVCQSIQDEIATISGRWLGNIAEDGDIDYSPIETFLNRADVRAAIHAQPDAKFSLFADTIADNYARGVMRDRSRVVAGLLDDGVPVMVVTGLNDAKDTNFVGARKWVSRMDWDGGRRYARAEREPWKPGGSSVPLGYMRSGGGLTTLEVLGAGHLAPRDQPLIATALQQFMARAPR